MKKRTVITAALIDVITTREQSPAIPYTPAEIGKEARRGGRRNGRSAYDVDPTPTF